MPHIGSAHTSVLMYLQICNSHEWYSVMKLTCKCTIFEIFRDFFALSCITCPRYPYV